MPESPTPSSELKTILERILTQDRAAPASRQASSGQLHDLFLQLAGLLKRSSKKSTKTPSAR